MDAEQLKLILCGHIDSLCSSLLPGGSVKGHEWVCGGVDGGGGSSMRVVLRGNRVGVWSDFATGQSGDVLELVKECNSISFKEAVDWAKDFCGIRDSHIDPVMFKPVPTPSKPMKQAPEAKPPESTPIQDWLNSRGIPLKTIEAYDVGYDDKTGMCLFRYEKQGKLWMVKYKDPEGKRNPYTNKGPTPILFGWQTIPKDADEIVITEGEIDAMSYHASGINAVSLPFGGGKGGKHNWIKNDFDALKQFKRIYLSMDMDEPGEEAKKELIQRLGRHRCYIVKLPHKDANECLQKDVDLISYIKKADTEDIENLTAAETYHEKVVERIRGLSDEPEGMKLPWYTTHQQVRFREGEVSIWTGINGHGKSMLLDHVMVDGLSQGYSWCVFSGEMQPVTHLTRVYRQIAGASEMSNKTLDGILEWITGGIFLFDVRGSSKSKDIWDAFEYAYMRYGCKQFIVDSLAKCGMREDDYNRQKFFIDKASDFAKDTNSHVHIVAHARKGESEKGIPGKLDVKGTGAATDMVDNVFSVWRNKVKEEAIQECNFRGVAPPEEILEQSDAVVKCSKQRNGDWEGSIRLWFDLDSYQYRDSRLDGSSVYVRE